jgi:hypothetical protein
MEFRDSSVTPVLVGLHRGDIVGLADASSAAKSSGSADREGRGDWSTLTAPVQNKRRLRGCARREGS